VPESFGKYVIEQQKTLDLDDSEAAYLAGSMFGAGSDTSASAISVAVMAAARNPDMQKVVQDELDAVLGKGRRESIRSTMQIVIYSEMTPTSTNIRRPRQFAKNYGFCQ
jgi:cytochrome P450